MSFQESNVKFHVVGLKCQNPDCGGYNTTRTQKRLTNAKTTASSSSSDNKNDETKEEKDDTNGGGASGAACSSSSNNRNQVAQLFTRTHSDSEKEEEAIKLREKRTHTIFKTFLKRILLKDK